MKHINILSNSLKNKLLATFTLLLCTNAFAQKITSYPLVDEDSSDETSIEKITSVITDDEYTIVTFQYATTLFNPWIMINSKTYLKTNLSNSELKIQDWGVLVDDKKEPFVSLRLNEQYSIKRRTSYDFYMAFPAIPKSAQIIDVFVPAQHLESEISGFYWKGIHVNSSKAEDFSNDKQYYSGNREFTPSGSGSGFAISADGYVATCYHVVENARDIRIKGINGDFNQAVKAKVAFADVQHDLAILKIDDASLSRIPYAFETQLSDVGEEIFVLGYPQTHHLGEELKLTTGVISSRSGYRGDATIYQISAQALPGNSGCPLFDNDGNVIGVVSAKYIEPNVSYAVKMSWLKALIDKSNISLSKPVRNTFAGKSLADKVKSIRNFIYLIEIQ
jgi:S1-C subfamily serine protease